MKSTRLSFDTAIGRSALRRQWPVWLLYLGYLTAVFPLSLASQLQRMSLYSAPLGLAESGVRFILQNACGTQPVAGMIMAILTVLLLFRHLYSSRDNTLINILPVRRERVYFTLFLTGLVPTLLVQLLVMLAAMALGAPYGLPAKPFFLWFGCAALSFLCYYGIACFCAMLTGNALILTGVFFVLNFAAVIFESAARECLSGIVYGLSYTGMRFSFLSPPEFLSDRLTVEDYPVVGAGVLPGLEGFGVLIAYGIAGLVLAFLGMLLYRKRRMESVGDFVAIPVLRPIFRYCMGFGGAFVLAAMIFSNSLRGMVFGAKAAWLLAVLLVAGAVLGWIIAEMLIRRSFRIFPIRWKGLAVVCAVCVLTVLAAETDITGYERRVPDPEQVESISFSYDTELREPENIRAFTELHRKLIEEKAVYDTRSFAPAGYTATGSQIYYTDRGDGFFPTETVMARREDEAITFYLPIRYELKNGKSMSRYYPLYVRAGEVDDPETVIGSVLELLNTREGIFSRMETPMPVTEEYIELVTIHAEEKEGTKEYRLTAKEAEELWNSAMLPDAEAQDFCLYTIADTDANLETQTNLRIFFRLESEDGGQYRWWSHSFRVFTFSENCLNWIAEHTDIEWTTLKEVYDSVEG